MKPDHNLQYILARGENSTTEFKENVSSSLDKEIVAFANTEGETIYIGVSDQGEALGIDITNKLRSRVHNIAHNCDPEIAISLHELTQERILIVDVKESDNKPHRCSSGFYIRADATTQN